MDLILGEMREEDWGIFMGRSLAVVWFDSVWIGGDAVDAAKSLFGWAYDLAFHAYKPQPNQTARIIPAFPQPNALFYTTTPKQICRFVYVQKFQHQRNIIQTLVKYEFTRLLSINQYINVLSALQGHYRQFTTNSWQPTASLPNSFTAHSSFPK